MVRRETTIACMLNVVVTLVATFLLNRGREQIPLMGLEGAVWGLLPGTFLFTLIFTLVSTLVVRRRVARGGVRRLQPYEDPRWSAWLPEPLLLRALLLAIAVSAISVGGVFAILHYRASDHWSLEAVMALNAVHFLVITWVVATLVVWRAMRD